MDLTKFALYTSLAAITYLMLLAWQEDYPSIVDTGSINQQSPPPLTLSSPQADDIPREVPTSSQPVNQPLISSGDVNGSTGESTTDIIQISTDTLQLSIDLTGGDIVGLSLPKYLKQLDVIDDPFVILESSTDRNYVAQSGLIGQNGVDTSGRALYRAEFDSYELQEDANSLQVDLVNTQQNGVTITKRFSFKRDSYLIDIDFLIQNNTETNWQANAFGQIRRNNFDDPSSVGGFGRTFLGFVTTSTDDPYIKIEFDDIDGRSESVETPGGWVGFSQHYFLSAWIPNQESVNRFTTRKNESGQYLGEFTGSAFSVPANSSGNYQIQFYAGPKDQYSLAEISPNLDLTIDYGFLWFLAAPIYWLLTRIDSVIGNYGVSIILLTFFVKALFYKLSETQYKSMAGMRRLMPKMQQIKDRYGDDKMGLQKATMDLYKKEKINPFGGCLPMLVQMPVFIALYWVLMESVELRHAPFIGWLIDLSVRDPFFILPLLMGATMFLQTKLSPAPADPMQAKVMQLMPVMMTALFLWFPAGLVLYWLTNGLLGILQQWYITSKIEAAYAAK